MQRHHKFILLLMAVAFTAACGKGKKTNNGGNSNNTKTCLTGAACKPNDTATIEVTVEANWTVHIDSEVIAVESFPGKTAEKTVDKKTYKCSINPIESVEIPYEVKGDKLHIGTKIVLTRNSGTSNELWGEWKHKEMKDEDSSVQGLWTFFADSPTRMLVKGTCYIRKR